ncbi:MAG TPA: type II toxin-antitoxin system VapC family toxin [Arachnia sp.]|nr:type II toxin-antitoxin system VapC family toxin [Arachnia sp.]HMT85257.1 type II toxin-antitoxin system VapC family toxin [Arachnia sp.]
MIVDTSAFLSVILGEPDAESYLERMTSAGSLAVSAATLTEAFIVAEARQGREAATDLAALLADLDVDVVAFDEEQAELASSAWRRFGKGRHPAGLNLGDTFSYALAAHRGEALLFKGKDFAATDIPSA